MKTWHLLFLSAVLAVGCESYMDYPDMGEKGKLYLECFPGAEEDSTILILSRAFPVNHPEVGSSMDHVLVGLSVNASPIEWTSCREVNGGLRLAALTNLSEGDAVMVTVQDAGEEPVQKESCVPAGPSFSFSRELTSEWMDRYHISIDKEKIGVGKQYYGISLEGMGHNTISRKGSKVVELVPYPDLQYELKGEDELSLADHVEGRFSPVLAAGKRMIVFEVDESDPSPVELILDTPNIGYHYVWAHPDVVALQCVYYRLEVYRFAPDVYHFLNPQENISLIGAGLVPPVAAKGNLKGAFGMFECIGRSATEWFPGLGLDSWSLF